MTCNKISYYSKSEAKQQLKLIKNDHRRFKGGKDGTGNKSLWVYFCRDCSTWHLTSKAPLKHLKRRSRQ